MVRSVLHSVSENIQVSAYKVDRANSPVFIGQDWLIKNIPLHLFIHMCKCVCACVYMSECACVSVCVCVSMCVHVCMHVCMHVCVRVCVSLCVHCVRVEVSSQRTAGGSQLFPSILWVLGVELMSSALVASTFILILLALTLECQKKKITDGDNYNYYQSEDFGYHFIF